jgi:hypothetical protein
MGDGSAGSARTPPPSEGGGEITHAPFLDESPTQPLWMNVFQPGNQPVTGVAPWPPAMNGSATIAPARRPEAATGPSEPVAGPPAAPPPRPHEVLRYGPGVPVRPAGTASVAVGAAAAASAWQTGQRAGPDPRRVRRRRLLGLALTVILLIAAAVVAWLRFFDHPAFGVTGVTLTKQVRTSCGMDVTGRIATNGSAGTISYQWVFQPQAQAPQPQSQSVVSGQHDVYVTVAIEGQGHGSATQAVTLDVLGPETGTASTRVTISC